MNVTEMAEAVLNAELEKGYADMVAGRTKSVCIMENGRFFQQLIPEADIIVDLELEHSKVLSVLRIDYEKFKIWEDTMPFYKNMKQDGVILWQVA